MQAPDLWGPRSLLFAYSARVFGVSPLSQRGPHLVGMTTVLSDARGRGTSTYWAPCAGPRRTVWRGALFVLVALAGLLTGSHFTPRSVPVWTITYRVCLIMAEALKMLRSQVQGLENSHGRSTRSSNAQGHKQHMQRPEAPRVPLWCLYSP